MKKKKNVFINTCEVNALYSSHLFKDFLLELHFKYSIFIDEKENNSEPEYLTQTKKNTIFRNSFP